MMHPFQSESATYHLKEIDLHLTATCNCKCVFCSYAYEQYNHPAYMSDILFRKILSEAKALGVEDIHFTGGEPTLHPHFVEYLHTANKADLKMRLISNFVGFGVSELQQYYDAGLRNVMVSLDGPPDIHNALRQRKVYDQTKANLIWCIEHDMFVRVNSVLLSSNIDRYMEFLEGILPLEVDVVSIFLFAPIGQGAKIDSEQISPYRWHQFIHDLKNFLKELQVTIPVIIEPSFCFNDVEEPIYDYNILHGCGSGCFFLPQQRHYLIILTDGNTYPCVFFTGASEYSLGNCSQMTLQQIVYNPRWSFYEALKTPPFECKDCIKWPKCYGGCRGFSKIYSGSYLNRDPRCPNTRLKNGDYYPLCNLMKLNLTTGLAGGSSEEAINRK